MFLCVVYPTFTKMPDDVTVRAGTTARLECAAMGHPQPVIAWQKDGGDDFPAARERRMHVMPEDDVFFIVNVKSSDQGVYSCTATNDAGTVVANATVNVLGNYTLSDIISLTNIWIIGYMSLHAVIANKQYLRKFHIT